MYVDDYTIKIHKYNHQIIIHLIEKRFEFVNILYIYYYIMYIRFIISNFLWRLINK